MLKENSLFASENIAEQLEQLIKCLTNLNNIVKKEDRSNFEKNIALIAPDIALKMAIEIKENYINLIEL